MRSFVSLWFGALAAVSLCRGAAAGPDAYPPAANCAGCHAEEHAEWKGARHSKMLQAAGLQAVKGDFSRGALELRGQQWEVRRDGASFYMTRVTPDGQRQEHRVDYTLGNRRIQHYLTKLPDGRMLVLGPSWDVLRKQWFHNRDIVLPDLESAGGQGSDIAQVWNKNCYSCHVSQERKNFRMTAAGASYDTQWTDFGTNCGRCHGPSNGHAARQALSDKAKGPADDVILQTRLDAGRNSMVCAQCHSLREIWAEGYTAGEDYNDYYLSVLEYNEKDDVRDRSYWADGRTRRFSADALGLWQSQCNLKGGATCLNCHTNLHDPEIEKAPQLQPASNAICANCHREIARAVPAHTHHGKGSAGSSCVECHMPRTVFSIKAAIRDHSMSLPTPENTIRHKIPNACNEACHKNRDAGWAAARLKEWYGTGKRAKMARRADAFSRARAGDTGAIEGLLAIQADAGESFPIRANAVGHLGRFSGDPRVMPVLLAAISARGPGSDPRIRAAAAMSVQGPGRAGAIADALKAGLSDPARTVRIAAALGLVNLGPSHLPLGDPAFTRAVAETRQQFEISADDADRQLEAGWFYLKSGDPARALNAVKITSRLDPQLPVRYLEGGALAMLGRMEEARRALQQVPRSDRWYREAQQMLGALAGR